MNIKKSIEFSAKNVKEFTGWLKRFASIDNSLLLEIDEKTSDEEFAKEQCDIFQEENKERIEVPSNKMESKIEPNKK